MSRYLEEVNGYWIEVPGEPDLCRWCIDDLCCNEVCPKACEFVGEGECENSDQCPYFEDENFQEVDT